MSFLDLDFQQGDFPVPSTEKDRMIISLRRYQHYLLPRLEQLATTREALASDLHKTINTVNIERHKRSEQAWLERKAKSATHIRMHKKRSAQVESLAALQNFKIRPSTRSMMAAESRPVPTIQNNTKSSSSGKRRHADADVNAEERAHKRTRSLRKLVAS
ncbi:hypothetical protein BDN71DRAFT_1500046 [Pleurotus eryngii]|uniref:Uncharacterized protein n=1 Tax=Pleurotus eryngii TaxID=5323 RepID=A0A9P6D8W6_PLEER|nr:hypothetical protein BDN71DRAFT_1500046 [Pleurotus eryngii]